MQTFFKALFHNPRATGAVLPSSKYLANKMAMLINKNKPGFILELGPGTGAITKAILKSGVSSNKLIALEIASRFAQKLKKRFPDITVIQGDARDLSKLIEDKKPIHTIISSLPFRSLITEDREKIFQEILKVLSQGGEFIQFTYNIKNPADFYPANFILKESFIVWRNIPPARVMIFKVLEH